jgi:hypothetical protein
MESDLPRDAVIRLAERAASHPFFVAYQLALVRSTSQQTIAARTDQTIRFALVILLLLFVK